MKRSLHGDRDHPDIAGSLLALSTVSLLAGDPDQAKQWRSSCECLPPCMETGIS